MLVHLRLIFFLLTFMDSSNGCPSSIWSFLMSLYFWYLVRTSDFSFNTWAFSPMLFWMKTPLATLPSMVLFCYPTQFDNLQYPIQYNFCGHFITQLLARVCKSKKTDLLLPSCKTSEAIEYAVFCSHKLSHLYMKFTFFVAFLLYKFAFTSLLMLVPPYISISYLTIWHKAPEEPI